MVEIKLVETVINSVKNEMIVLPNAQLLKSELVTAGTALEVEIFGKRYPATVQADGPLYDPENARLKA